ncbi:hypothetical protein A9K55_006495 [Cordyceps militaris]|uniref:Uncharacterized protein n=1 Tax=Cordyceps militaris TaxID=73501 RepID=A0A2H4SDC1_CORMI|nr:hypothetical protein A9K55_006495 [Cordyceps militaris]
MAQSAAAPKPRGFSRFSKALPAVPQLLRSSSRKSSLPTSHQLPPLPKDLPELPPPPPPPPHNQGSGPPQLPMLFDKSPPLPLSAAVLPVSSAKMSIPRRPVAAATNNTMLSPFPEPSPTASLSSLISAYSRPFDSPTTTPHTGAFPDTPLASSREASPPPEVPEKKTDSTASHNRLPPPISKTSFTDTEVPPAPPSKSELWRRRPQNDSREISGLNLEHSHGSTVSSTTSVVSASTTSTQRPSTAVQEELQSQPAKLRKPPSVGGLPGRNVRPSAAAKEDPRPSTTPSKPTINMVQSEQSLPSLSKSAAPPPSNRPPTPEYQMGESRATVVTTFTSPASPDSSPESPSRFSSADAKELPPPPPKNPTRDTPTTTTPKPGSAPSSTMLTEMPRRKPTTGPVPTREAQSPSVTLQPVPPPARGDSLANKVQSPSVTSPPFSPPARRDSLANKVQPPSATSPAVPPPARRDSLANRVQPPLAASPAYPSDPSRARTPLPASTPSDQSRGSSVSPTRQPRRDQDQTPRQQRRPYSDQRIVQTEQGPMYRGRDGTLYPEMKTLREPDPRAFRFPTWTNPETTAVSTDGIYAARALKESHYSCFQKHAMMNRRSNRHYPLTCQTCDQADANDRWACAFCHLRICEPCYRALVKTRQRDLTTLVADIGRRAPLRLSSGASPAASALGL